MAMTIVRSIPVKKKIILEVHSKVRVPKLRRKKKERDNYFNWHPEVYRRLRDSKIVSLKDLV